LFTKFAERSFAVCVFAALVSLFSAAQQTALPAAPEPSAQEPTQSSAPQNQSAHPPQQKPSPTQQPPAEKGKSNPATGGGDTNSGTSNDRLFFALPNFLTLENGVNVPPLTAKQKYAVVAKSAFDYVQLPWYAFLSGISQAEGNEDGFGQGAAGYGKRFAATAADGTIENFMTGAILPSLLHQDPRFFQSGKGGFTHRAGYAVSRILITRTDSGGSQFNYSEVFGSALSASISTYSYHPRSRYVSTPTNPHLFIPSDRTLTNTAKVWGSQVGYDTMTIVIKEFWPDIHRKMSRKHKSDAVGQDSSRP
jgi:hypothetical protein